MSTPITSPRGTVRVRAALQSASRCRVRVYIWGEHEGVPSPGDALLHVATGDLDLELVISGAEIEPVADAFLACVQMRAEHEDYLSSPVSGVA